MAVIAALLVVPAIMAGIAVLGAVVHTSSAQAGPCASAPTPDPISQPSSSNKAKNSIPANYLNLYRKAGRQYDVPWNVLAGIGKEESDHGRGTAPGIRSGQNSMGAQGPMQFLSSTWKAYGVDGDRNGTKDVYNPADAIFGAANYLRHNHADKGGKHLYRAIFAYNHADWYVKNVLRDADQYAQGNFSVGGTNTVGTSCIPTRSGDREPSINGPFGARVVAYARKWARTKPPTPYVWGQGNIHGPTRGCGHGFCGTGFDCSGLTQYAVYQASGGKITIPHYTFDQLSDRRGEKVTWGQLQPGDLIFLSGGDHVVIFAGSNTIIEAPYTGSHVRIAPLRRNGFIGARRFGRGIP